MLFNGLIYGWVMLNFGFLRNGGSYKDRKRYDYTVTSAYIYIDGRGNTVRFGKAAGNGIGICRIMEEGKYEIIC